MSLLRVKHPSQYLYNDDMFLQLLCMAVEWLGIWHLHWLMVLTASCRGRRDRILV